MTISFLPRSAWSSFASSCGVIRPRKHLASPFGFRMSIVACRVLSDDVARSGPVSMLTVNPACQTGSPKWVCWKLTVAVPVIAS
jgi:hypothetical protein